MRTSKHFAAPFSAPPRAQYGVTVLELLVAVVIGAVLIFGATQVYVDSRNNYTVNESVARLQETARYAMSVLEPDIQMSNYWGLVYGAEGIQGQANQSAGASSLGGTTVQNCGNNYAQDLQTNIQGTNDSYSLGCQAANNNPMPNADTITIRRTTVAKSDTTGTPSGPLRVCSTRSAGVLLTDSTTCSLAGGEFHDVIVDAYYVDKDSDQQTGLPSLRRKYLRYLGGTLDFSDAEITPGIEDMQVQYGVDTSGGLGVTSGAAVQYLDAGATLNGLLNNAVSPAQIVSVRIWLLVRAEQPEVGFTDARTYTYADRTGTATNVTNSLTVVADKTKSYQPSKGTDTGPNDPRHFRRVLIMKTIQLRNALGT